MKKGFTLAEVLITLAVIGVVAALSMPQLVTANKRQVYASSLSTTVTNVQTALTNMIFNENAQWLEDTAFYDALTASTPNVTRATAELGKYLDLKQGGTTVTSVETSAYSGNITGLGGNNDTVTMGSGFFFKMKNGALLNFVPQNFREDVNPNMPHATDTNGLYQQAFTLNIDINGIVEPNKCGRDIFKFAVGTDGKLYPFGGREFARYVDGATWNDADSNSFVGSSNCCSCNLTASSTTLGWGCAGRLAETGYVMDY